MEANPPSEAPSCNLAIVAGDLVQAPEERDLPSGSSLISFSLTVRNDGHKTTSVPITWFDPPKRALRWKAGDRIVATGPVVRRFYRAGGATASRTEVAVVRAESLASTKRALVIIADAAALVAGLEQAVEPP